MKRVLNSCPEKAPSVRLSSQGSQWDSLYSVSSSLGGSRFVLQSTRLRTSPALHVSGVRYHGSRNQSNSRTSLSLGRSARHPSLTQKWHGASGLTNVIHFQSPNYSNSTMKRDVTNVDTWNFERIIPWHRVRIINICRAENSKAFQEKDAKAEFRQAFGA